MGKSLYFSLAFFALFNILQLTQANGRLEYLQHNSGNYEARLYLNVSEDFVDWEGKNTMKIQTAFGIK